MLKYFIALGLISSPLIASDSLLNDVQKNVNDQFKFKEDNSPYDVWKLPKGRFTNCKGYTLAKRKALIDSGWSEDDLEVLLLVTDNDYGKAKAKVGHVVLKVKSQNVILDMPEPGAYSAPKPIMKYDEYLKKENYKFFCKINDISDKQYKNVSERCAKRK